MANPNSNSNSSNPTSTTPSLNPTSTPRPASAQPASSTAPNVASTLRDAADRFTSQINKADPKQIMSDATGAVGDFYGEASHWFAENREMVTYVGIGLVAGLAGFFLGRSRSQSME